MTYDPGQRRRALNRFLKANTLTLHQLTVTAGLNEATTRGFMKGGERGTRSLRDETYEQLAEAATALLGRPVTANELRGEAPPLVIKVESFVGAGAEVLPFDGDSIGEWADAPPSKVPLGAAIVQGDSGLPLFENGDVLFFPAPSRAVARYKGRIVIAKLDDGRRVVKRLQPGSAPNAWHLVSINPASPTIENAVVDSVAPIPWIQRAT